MKASKNTCVSFILVALYALSSPRPASAQSQGDGWRVSVYPVYAMVPLGIGIDVDLPPIDGGGSAGGKIIEGRFDGAYLGGVSAAKGAWRIDADGLWAAVGGDRPERPVLRVDVDVVYGHASGGREVLPDLYLTAGVRRFSLKYDIALGERQFARKPGVWDPLVGIGWHHIAGRKLELHATFEGGGFGVGADADISTSFRLDWKPTTHFGLVGGYGLLYFKITDTLAGQTFTVDQWLHGPIAGIGLYF
jgi:hypothetical protein